MTSRDGARTINATINERSRRLKDRIKQNASNVVNTNGTKKLKEMTKKAGLVALLEKKRQAGDNGDTPNLADDELVNDTLKQTSQLGKDKFNVCGDNHTELTTIAHKKKDEVSLLSVPSQSTVVLLKGSVFSKLNHVVKLPWKQRTKELNKFF